MPNIPGVSGFYMPQVWGSCPGPGNLFKLYKDVLKRGFKITKQETRDDGSIMVWAEMTISITTLKEIGHGDGKREETIANRYRLKPNE